MMNICVKNIKLIFVMYFFKINLLGNLDFSFIISLNFVYKYMLCLYVMG